MPMEWDATSRLGSSRVVRERTLYARQPLSTYYPLPSTPRAHRLPWSTALRDSHSTQTARIHFPLPSGYLIPLSIDQIPSLHALSISQSVDVPMSIYSTTLKLLPWFKSVWRMIHYLRAPFLGWAEGPDRAKLPPIMPLLDVNQPVYGPPSDVRGV
ncbi:hypothetical protein BD779DRAFT_1480756 [Infundibulicybe gibba]|nr:hypothetical protein BD779DRAFT_1480756 [Infundibulicybe gibba]